MPRSVMSVQIVCLMVHLSSPCSATCQVVHGTNRSGMHSCCTASVFGDACLRHVTAWIHMVAQLPAHAEHDTLLQTLCRLIARLPHLQRLQVEPHPEIQVLPAAATSIPNSHPAVINLRSELNIRCKEAACPSAAAAHLSHLLPATALHVRISNQLLGTAA